MRFRRVECQYCGFEGRPIKGTVSRIKRKGMTKLCPSCRGPIAQS